jgi:hypothetical protein
LIARSVAAGFSRYSMKRDGASIHQLWNNVSVKAEYLYVNLGHGNTVDVVAQVGFPPSSFSASYGRN